MAIVSTALQPATHGWALSASSADVSGTEVLQAAPGAGKQLVLTSISISSKSSVIYQIGEGDSADDPPEGFIFRSRFAAGYCYVEYHFDRPIVLTINKALLVDADAGGQVYITAQGYTI